MKSVYTGGEKVAEFESYDEFRVGDGKPAFIYEGNDLVYPNPVKDGLVLWYDFSGRTNADGQRGIAEDLSGNGNHGTLQNFNFTPESGYDKNKLLFDGVDDRITAPPSGFGEDDFTMEIVLSSEGYMSFYTIFAKADRVSAIYNENAFGLTYIANPKYPFLIYYADGVRQLVRVGLDEEFPPSHIVMKKEGLNVSVYINGVKTVDNTHESIETSEVASKSVRISENAWTTVGSVKAYNRPLTPEEIAHNYAIEKERFGIE